MKLARTAFLVLISTLAIVSCGGGGGSGGTTSPPAVTAPSELKYTTPQTLTVNKAITALQPTVTGAVTSYSVSPALPAGLTLDTTSGAISGTPTAVTAQATYTVTATNSGGNTTAALVITVNDVAPVVSYSSGRIALAQNLPVTTLAPDSTGGAVVSWSISPALPAGLTFSESDGTISGTPTAASAAKTYTVKATNSAGDTTIALSLSVESGVVLDLGHGAGVVAIRYVGSRALSLDANGHWVLWDSTAGTAIASADSTCADAANQCVGGNPGSIDLVAGVFVLQTNTGFEIRSTTDGHILSTIAATHGPSGYSWWRLATDGSYLVAGGSAGLKAWSSSGQVLFSSTTSYVSGVVFAAPGEIRIAQGPAGAEAIEAISLPGGTSSVSSNYNGLFQAWFADGERFITQAADSTLIYSRTAVQEDITQATGSAFGGTGNWFYNNAGSRIDIYQVGASATPKASITVSNPTVILSGTTLGLLQDGQLSVVDFSLATPAKMPQTLPVAGQLAGYAATDAAHWFVGNTNGVVLNGTGSPATVRMFDYGKALSIAGSASRFAVATGSGRVMFYDSSTHVLEDTVQKLSVKLQLSADGTVLAALGSADVVIFSLPSKTITKTWTYPNSPVPTDITLSIDGTLLGQVASNGFNHQVTGVDGSPAIWTDMSGDGAIRLAPVSGNPIAINGGGPDSRGNSVTLVNNGTVASAFDGYAVGWIDSQRLVVSTFVDQGFGLTTFGGAHIYSSAGIKMADTPLQEIPDLLPVGADAIYSAQLNEILSPTTGAVSWLTPISTNKIGAIAGSSVVFASGASVIALSQ